MEEERLACTCICVTERGNHLRRALCIKNKMSSGQLTSDNGHTLQLG